MAFTSPGGLLNAGRLRWKGTIQQPVNTGVGNRQTWATFANAWMDVAPAQGAESMAGLGPTNVTFQTVTLRYQPGIAPKMRILFRGRTLEITSVLNVDERNHVLQLACREATS